MKNYKKIKILVPFIAALFFFQFSGCDEFESIPLNIPITVEFFNRAGSNITYDTGIYCLDDESETYRQYRDDIQSITFIEAAYRTISISDSDASGNISVTFYDVSNQVLASFQVNNVKPGDYITNPLILQFTQAEIQALNAILAANTCLGAYVEITSLSGSVTISGAVDMVFEADTKL